MVEKLTYTERLKTSLPESPYPFGHTHAQGISALEKEFSSLPIRSELWKYTHLKFDLEVGSISDLDVSQFEKKGIVLKRSNDLTPNELDSLFSRTNTANKETFISNLGKASFSEILYFKIESHFENQQPIKVRIHSKSNRVESLQIFMELHDSAQASIHFELESEGDGGYQVVNFHGQVRKNAALEVTSLRKRNKSGTLLDRHLEIQENAKLKVVDIDLGGDRGNPCRANTTVNLTEKHAQVDINGLVITGKNDHVDEHYFVNHLSRDTESRVLFKSALGGRSTVVYDGLVYINKDAQKVDSNQLSKSLLLSQGATVDAKPELEVFADDVKAAHGSTVGQLSPEEVFYLMSRGISKSRAVNLVALGFVKEIALTLTSSSIKDELLSAVTNRLSEVMDGVDLNV